jgi:hypothetical protein
LFVDRIESQDEIHKLIEEVFGQRTKISLEEFQEIVEKVTSEMFLNVSGKTLNNFYYLDRYLDPELTTLQ